MSARGKPAEDSGSGGASAAEPQVPYAVAARDLLRNTLLDGARRELASRPWSEVTMSDIAGAAGVSRQTVYNEFGSRAEFSQELVLREAGRFIDAVQSTIAANAEDPREALRATMGARAFHRALRSGIRVLAPVAEELARAA